MSQLDQQLTDRVFTVSNIITIIRILLIPVFLYFLFVSYTVEFEGEIYQIQGQNIYAFLIFVLASITDWLDGFIARKTNTCSKLGKILDPVADRGLIISCVIALSILHRLPWWITILVILRNLLFLIGGATLLKRYKIQIDVIMLGKVATTFMYIGLAGLILAWPTGPGFGWFNVSWLPGFGNDLCYYPIYLVYIGLILNIFTFTHYVKNAITQYNEVKSANR